MEQINELLSAWEEEGLSSGANIERAFEIISLLATKVIELEAEIAALK